MIIEIQKREYTIRYTFVNLNKYKHINREKPLKVNACSFFLRIKCNDNLALKIYIFLYT